jgi:hypothetical protein
VPFKIGKLAKGGGARTFNSTINFIWRPFSASIAGVVQVRLDVTILTYKAATVGCVRTVNMHPLSPFEFTPAKRTSLVSGTVPFMPFKIEMPLKGVPTIAIEMLAV